MSPRTAGGTLLDLVITNSAPLNILQVYDLGISDRKVVSLDLQSSYGRSNSK